MQAMIPTWKAQINLLLLMISINIVVSCLVTNCPRGGKRGRLDFYIPDNNLDNSKFKKCRLCSPGRAICSDDSCFENHCKDEGVCVNEEVCCTKKLCKLHKSCRSDFSLQKHPEPIPTYIILAQILRFTLDPANDLFKTAEQ